MINCQIKIKTAGGSYHYTGIFRSTFDAMTDAVKRIGYPCCVTVSVLP